MARPKSLSTPYQQGVNYYGLDNPGDNWFAPSEDTVHQAGKQYLGRDLTDASPWINDPNYFSNIYNSEEAYNHRANSQPVDTTASTQPTAPTQYGGQADAYSGPYAELPGYDYGKLSDPTHRGSGKYNSDVAMFSQALAATGAKPGQAGMQSVYDWLQNHGSNVSWNGQNDVFRFGDVDVDVSGNYNPSGEGSSWTFQDPRGAAQPGQGGAAPMGGPGGASSLLDWGAQFGGPGTAGIYGDSPLQQSGQDPFSQLLTGGLSNLITDASSRLHSTPQQQAIAMEAARSPYEAARKVQLRNAEAALADRGILGEPGQRSGQLTGAVQRIEEGLAPAYTGAIADEFGRLNDRELQAGNLLGNALQAGTGRQGVLADIALRSLEQNRLFDQFIAQFGLDKTRVLNDIASGQNDQLLRLLEIYMNGYI